jgi:hypothetical protein
MLSLFPQRVPPSTTRTARRKNSDQHQEVMTIRPGGAAYLPPSIVESIVCWNTHKWSREPVRNEINTWVVAKICWRTLRKLNLLSRFVCLLEYHSVVCTQSCRRVFVFWRNVEKMRFGRQLIIIFFESTFCLRDSKYSKSALALLHTVPTLLSFFVLPRPSSVFRYDVCGKKKKKRRSGARHQEPAKMTTTTMTVEASNGHSSTPPSSSIMADDDDNYLWLGSEPHLLLSVEEERQKIGDLLSCLTMTDRTEIERVDTSIPIRHLRAVKVSGRDFE